MQATAETAAKTATYEVLAPTRVAGRFTTIGFTTDPAKNYIASSVCVFRNITTGVVRSRSDF